MFKNCSVAGMCKGCCRLGEQALTRRSCQKARAAELNAARARRAAQMQSIDDEIPDLSGPVSLGTYKFTRRDRGKKNETRKLSEIQETPEEEQEKQEGENKVTELATTSSAHQLFNPPPPTTLSSSQLPEQPTHQTKIEFNNRSLEGLANPSPDRCGFHEPSPPQYDKLDPSHSVAEFPSHIRSIYTDTRSSQALGQTNSSFQPAQNHRSNQDSSALIIKNTPSSQTSGQAHPSFSPENHISNQRLRATIIPHRQILQPASGQPYNSFSVHDYSSNQNLNIPINTNRSLQAGLQSHRSIPPSGRKLNTSLLHSELEKTLKSLSRKDKPSPGASGQATSPFPSQDIQQYTSQPYVRIESKVNNLLATHRQSPQVSRQAHHSESPKAHSTSQSLPLSDTLPTASFNLATNQWDPDLPEANMSAQIPTNMSTRGGHAGHQSSRQSSSRLSHASQDVRNPHAIVTTTKSGRPYTNPYMPIHPPPSTARPIAKQPSSEFINPENQYDESEAVQGKENIRYIDQEEARYRALEQAEYANAEKSIDDPFQDQPTQIQHYGRNQSSTYAGNAAQSAAYGDFPGYGFQPLPTSYASDPSASSYHLNAQQATQAPNTGMSPYHSQHSTYEQQAVANARSQNLGAAPQEQRSAHEQHMQPIPRASVRLPAVRGTLDQQKVPLQEPEFGSLTLEDSTGNNTQDQRNRRTRGFQPVTGRTSHAIPIRDPAAYTGSGLTTRRNQEVLRQNLDTVVASSQGPTGSARTVMNDPHRDRQTVDRPSSTITDTTITGSMLRAQAPSYESASTQLPVATNQASVKPKPIPSTGRRQGGAAVGESEALPLQYDGGNKLKGPARATADAEIMEFREAFRAPTIPSGFGHDTAAYTKKAGLPIEAIGAGNAFMNAIAKQAQPKRNPQQSLEDAAKWFRSDPRDLSYAAEVLPREAMNMMNPEKFPLDDSAPRTVSQLADDSQDDDPSDRARQAATPRPIGHGRPAGLATPPSNQGPRQAAPQAPFSTLASVTSIDDKEGMKRSAREFLKEDAKAIEAMFGGVFGNLMEAKNGPYDYMSHYGSPPAYAIDHNPKNNDTLFDPQWFATAPPARVGRDPRREQGEYEDPTQGIPGRRGDHGRGEASRRGSSGLGGSGGRAWGRN